MTGPAATRVYLHIGAPLTGSEVIRQSLARHRRRLARVGILYPPGHLGYDGGHLDAVLDVLQSVPSGQGTQRGAWDRLAESVRDWRRGTVVLSHELLADATEQQVQRIVGSLGRAEVHVVYVARDLGRQLPRAWQEWVRNGGTMPFETYAERALRRDEHRATRAFWSSHDPVEVLRRWSTAVPVQRVHVLTAPLRGTGPAGDAEDRATLWSRFAETVGMDPRRFGPGRPGPGDAMDRLDALACTEVVRLLNQAGGDDTDPSGREAVLARLAVMDGPVPAVPPALRTQLLEEQRRAVDTLGGLGFDVVGSLEDLLSDDDAFATSGDQVTPSVEDVVRVQTRLLLGLTTTPRRRRGPTGIGRRALGLVARVRGRSAPQPSGSTP